MNWNFVMRLLVPVLLAGLLSVDVWAQDQPPIFNNRSGNPPFCHYVVKGSPCGAGGSKCLCSPSISGLDWPCDGCAAFAGWWPGFSMLFYPHKGQCPPPEIDFIDLPLLDLPTGFQAGDQFLAPNYSISISPIARLGRIREVALECSPERGPVDAAARYELDLSGFGSSADCDGVLFFVTAEYNPALFDVTVHGRIRTGSSYFCGSTSLQPFQPRLIVGTEVFSTNALRYPDLIANPDYVKVAIKAGRSPREAGTESVKLRVHSFNWGGDHHPTLCQVVGNCPEGYDFQQDAAATVQVYSLELPPNWCKDVPPLDPEDALAISTLSNEQRQAAQFDGFGAKLLNDLTAELPKLKMGHNRFFAGRTLESSLGNDAYWHSDYSCNSFVRINLFGAWCAVEDLPGWSWEPVGSDLIVHDPCEGLDYHYQRPGGGSLGEEPLKLAVVKRSGADVRTYAYDGGGVSGELISQTDADGNTISYGYLVGTDTELTVTGTAAAGGTRTVVALYTSGGFLKSATWANNGPARQYEFIVSPGNPALDGRIDRVLDPLGNVLLDFDYDTQGRLTQATRGSGPSLQSLSQQTYIDTGGGGGMLGDTFMVGQCFVDDTDYQATVYTFDEFNRNTEKEEFHDLQNLPVTSAAVPAFTGPSSLIQTLFRENEDLGIPGGDFTIEKVLPSATVAEYKVFDINFNTIRTFLAVPGLSDVTGATLISEKRFTHGQFAGVWQTTSEVNVARDNATATMGYDSGTGFIISRAQPSISAANSGNGVAIPAQSETFTYNPVNNKRIDTEMRNDGQDNTVVVTNTYDPYDNPSSRSEVGTCDTQLTLTEYNASGRLVEETDVDGYVTAMDYDLPGHPNDGSGLLLGQRTYQSGGSGPVLRQIRYFYYTTGKDLGRLERIEIADHVGQFTLDTPDGWQVTTFAYDDYGRVVTKTTTHTTKPGTFVWTYAYDSQDRATQITYPDDGLGGTTRRWVRTLREGRGRVVNEFVGSGGDPVLGSGGTVVLTNTYAYDANGNLSDRLNQTAAELPDHSAYTYDIYNRREKRTDVDDGSVGYDVITHFEYNGGMDLTREYIQEGTVGPIRVDVRMDIDELGRVWEETILENPAAGLNPARDRITTSTFDILGNEVGTRVVDTVVGDAVTTRVFTCFDDFDTETVTLTDTESALTDYTTDRRGNVTRMVDPVLNATEHDYDATSQRVETRDYERIGGGDVLQLRTTTAWTSLGGEARSTRFDAGSNALDQRRTTYDALGFESQRARMADPGNVGAVSTSVDRVTDMTHDGVGHMLTETTYADGTARLITRTYDDVGRPDAITYPAPGNGESFTYYPNTARVETRTITDENGSRDMTTAFDAYGRLKSETAEAIPPAVAVTTTFAYDAADRRTAVTHPLNFVEVHGYDGIGQRTSLIEDSGGANERTITFQYTQKGDLSKVTSDDGEGPQDTTYASDRAGRRVGVTHPSACAQTATFDFDAAGRLESRTAEDNFVTFFEYNWRDQPVTKRESNAGGTILEEFRYDPLGRMTAAGVGPLASAAYQTTFLFGNGTDVDVNGTLDPAYVDAPVSETQTVDDIAKTFTRAYNTAGERSLLAYPNDCNTTLTYGYESSCGCPSGQVTSIDRNGARLANYEYAGQHVTSRQVRTAAPASETWVEVVWDRPDQLRRPGLITNRIRTGSTGGVGGVTADLMVFDNLFDAADNLDTQSVSGSPIENGLTDFTYDRLNRLVQADYPDATSEVWQLDDMSNWEQHTARDTSITTYADSSCNQYTSISTGANTPVYDAKGNLTRNERGYGFAYDFENRLTRVFADPVPPGARIVAARSCLHHCSPKPACELSTNEWCLDLNTGGARAGGDNIEPRISSLNTFEFDLDGSVGSVSASVACDVNPYAGTPSVSLVDADTIRVTLDPALPDQDCCTITLSGDAQDTYAVRLLAGDVSRNGVVNATDKNIVKGNLGRPVDAGRFLSDVNVTGIINATDKNLVKGWIGNTAPSCATVDFWAEYVVDALGRRVQAIVGGVTKYRYYDGQVLLAEYEAKVWYTPQRLFVNGPTYLDEKLLMRHDAVGEFYYLLKDLYSVAGLTNLVGVVVESYSYTGYGLPTIDTPGTSPGNPFFFTSQRLDVLEVGNLLLYDYKARAFDPLHGRFQQRDPVEFADAYNVYEYARSRPTLLTDPSGNQIAIGQQGITAAIMATLFAILVPALPNAADVLEDVLYALWRNARDLIRAIERVNPIPLPPGDCTPSQHAALQATVDTVCGVKRSCIGVTDCSVLYARVGFNNACIAARSAINKLCFRGGDTGHTQAEQDAANARNKCLSLIEVHCR